MGGSAVAVVMDGIPITDGIERATVCLLWKVLFVLGCNGRKTLLLGMM